MSQKNAEFQLGNRPCQLLRPHPPIAACQCRWSTTMTCHGAPTRLLHLWRPVAPGPVTTQSADTGHGHPWFSSLLIAHGINRHPQLEHTWKLDRSQSHSSCRFRISVGDGTGHSVDNEKDPSGEHQWIGIIGIWSLNQCYCYWSLVIGRSLNIPKDMIFNDQQQWPVQQDSWIWSSTCISFDGHTCCVNHRPVFALNQQCFFHTVHPVSLRVPLFGLRWIYCKWSKPSETKICKRKMLNPTCPPMHEEKWSTYPTENRKSLTDVGFESMATVCQAGNFICQKSCWNFTFVTNLWIQSVVSIQLVLGL